MQEFQLVNIENTKKMELLKKQIEEIKSSNNPDKNSITTNNNNNTIKISIKNYIQQNYSDAPPLLEMADYARLTYDDESGDNDQDTFNCITCL